MRGFSFEKGVHAKIWADYVPPIDENAMKQIENICALPFIYKHVAVMPDAHYGIGSTVGSVIPTKGAIVPAAVGVDIGCGMMALKTSLTASDLPDNLFELRSLIEAAIPVGFNQFTSETAPWTEIMSCKSYSGSKNWYNNIVSKHPKIRPNKEQEYQLGTLGGGNHFIELCLDKSDSLWIMLHSGSRGIGNRIGTYFIEQAKEEMRKYHMIDILPDKDLSYLVEHTDIFYDYIYAMEFAQDYALRNREVMMKIMRKILLNFFFPKKDVHFFHEATNCHHNYTTREHHFGEEVWITRKGAVNAEKDRLGIIPGSMGAKSFIVRGLGNPESFNSCSHGAGRVMSRTKAKDRISLYQHIKDTEGVECRKDNGVIDETPRAYKNIDHVMRSQEDLVEVVYELKQILCVKG